MTETDKLLQQAEKAEQAGALEEARQLYEEVLAIDADHEGAALGLVRLASKEEPERTLRDLIDEGDALLAKDDYAAASSRYRQALNHARQANTLKYHATLEGKISQARESDAWKRRVEEAVAQAQERSQQGEADEALQQLLALRHEFSAEPAYGTITKELEQAIANMDEGNPVEKLFQKAQKAYTEQDYERTIEVLKMIPAGLSSTHRRARRLLGQAEDEWLRFIQPSKERIEALIGEGDWADTFAELDLFKQQFPQSPVWQSFWLQTSIKSGQQALLKGREANIQGDFKQAISWFEEARRASAKVLELYQAHSTATHLQPEALDLILIASDQEQARVAWKNGQRREASSILERAQERIEQALEENREYLTVAAVVDAMTDRLVAEIERIEQEEACLLNGERLLAEKRLTEAAQEFNASLKALLPAHQAEAKKGLRQAENQMRAYEEEYERGRKSDDLASKVEAYQNAYQVWPSAPQMPSALLSALLAAAEEALAEGREGEAIAYATQVLEFDPEHEEAKRIIQKPSIQANVQAALQQTTRDLDELNQRAEVSSQEFEPLQVRLQKILVEADAFPDLAAQVEELLERVQRRYNEWLAFEQGYEQAQRLKERGEWEAAIQTLEVALQPFGQALPKALADQQKEWHTLLQTIQATQTSGQALWEEAQAAYEALSQEGDYEKPLILLSQLDEQLTAVANECQAKGGRLSNALVILRQEAAQLHQRAEVVYQAARAATAFDALVIIRNTIWLRGSDATLKALETKWEQRAEVETDNLLLRAETLLEGGELSQALELLRQVHDFRPNDERIASRYAALLRRERLEQELQEVLQDAQAKLAMGSLPDAHNTLRRGISILLAVEEGLPDGARHILLELLQLGEQEEQLAFGRHENWQKAQALLTQLVQQPAGQQRWAVRLGYHLAEQWARLTHDMALRGLIRGLSHLGDWLGAYRAAATYVRQHPTDIDAIQDLAETREGLINQLNGTADKRLERAQLALERGDYERVLDNVSSLEEEIYRPIEQEFPNILDHTYEAKRAQAEQLRAEAEQLNSLHEQVIPNFEAAEEAFAQGRLEDSEAKLQRIPPLKDKEAPLLAHKVEKLRANIEKARQERSRAALHQLIVRAQTTLVTATTIDEIEHLLRDLERFPQQIDSQYAPPEEQHRYYDLLDQARERQQMQRAGKTWEAQAQEFLQQEQYIKAESALKEALAATREGEKRVFLQVQLYSVEEQAAKQRHQQEAVARARELLIQRQYGQARRELRWAQDAGAQVAALLSTARAGILLEDAKRVWQEELDWEGANEDLEEALSLAEAHQEASELVPEIRRWQRRIKRECEKEEQKREREAQERQRKQQEYEEERLRQEQEREEERQRTQFISEVLYEARRALATGDLTLADEQVRVALKEEASHPQALQLLEQVQRTYQAQELFRDAEEASRRADFQKAQALTHTILGEILPHYAPALALLKALEKRERAIKALLRAENLARHTEFQAARQALDEAVALEAERDALQQVWLVVDELEGQWEKEIIHPIRQLFEDGKYRPALERCQQALQQASSKFQAELKSLQGEIVEQTLNELRPRFRDHLDQDVLSEIMIELGRLESLEPEPAPYLKREISRLGRQLEEARLSLLLDMARHEAEQENWHQALEIIESVRQQANELTLGRIAHQATVLEMNIEDQRQSVEQERAQTQRQHPDLDLNDGTRSPYRHLEGVSHLLNQLLTMQHEYTTQQLKLYQSTLQALKESRQQMQDHHFKAAETTLRVSEISPLLQAPYEELHTLVNLLYQAQQKQERQEWQNALNDYQQAIAQDPTLGLLLEDDLKHCRTEITKQILAEAQTSLTATPPDAQKAQRLFDQAEEKGWLEPTLKTEIQKIIERIYRHV